MIVSEIYRLCKNKKNEFTRNVLNSNSRKFKI